MANATPESDPLGRIALLVIILVLFYDTIFSLVKASVETVVNITNGFANAINTLIISLGGGSPLFPTTESLVQSIFSWEAFLFTNAMALAVIFFIDIVKMAYKGG